MAAASKVKLKLLVDTNGRKVLFAEAGKDFVDFLFYLLSIPAGAIVKLLKKESMAGCLSDLYRSIQNLSESFMQQNRQKDSVLNPGSSLDDLSGIPHLLPPNHHQQNKPSTTRKFYACPRIFRKNDFQPFPSVFASTAPSSAGGQCSYFYVSDVSNLVCPHCKSPMSRELSYISADTVEDMKDMAAEGRGGFVKGVVTYMIGDNLEVKPMSGITSITLLNKFNVTDVSALEEKVVELGVDEGLKLLKASLECKNVLTSVFLSSH